MKMLVIGASGLAGRHIVDFASSQNMLCTAFAPNISSLGINSVNVRLEKGDANNLEDLRRVMQGQDVIVFALGTDKCDHPCDDRTKAMENVITVMRELNLKRILVVSGAGIANFSEDKLLLEMPDFPKDLLNVSKDHLGAWKLLKNSNLNYTVFAEPTIKTDIQSGNSIIKTDFFPQDACTEVSVKDLAEAIVNEARENKYSCKRVIVACRKSGPSGSMSGTQQKEDIVKKAAVESH